MDISARFSPSKASAASQAHRRKIQSSTQHARPKRLRTTPLRSHRCFTKPYPIFGQYIPMAHQDLRPYRLKRNTVLDHLSFRSSTPTAHTSHTAPHRKQMPAHPCTRQSRAETRHRETASAAEADRTCFRPRTA
ncbi:hypothetical protein L1887_63513 [Cichorium endivia]|nr:hypothetical protein L1887_63513 [Cichorium endivia]